MHKEEAFTDESKKYFHSTPREAALCIQCHPPPKFDDSVFADSDFTKLECASEKFNLCPVYPRPTEERSFSKRIKFHAHGKIPHCSKYGVLPPGSASCPLCDAKKSKKRQGNFREIMHQVIEKKYFQEF